MTIIYITNASLNMIAKSLKGKIAMGNIDDTVQQLINHQELSDFTNVTNIREIFNINEIQELYRIMLVVKDLKKIIMDIKGNKEIITQYINMQNRRYAFEVKAPAYHKERECKWLLSPFENVEIPERCVDEEGAKKAKAWVRKHKSLLFEELNEKFKKHFNCEEGLILVERKNSGQTDFEDKNLVEIVSEGIVKKYRQLRFFFDHEFADKVRNLRYMPFYKVDTILQNDKDTQTHQTVYEFHQVKSDLKHMLINFYIAKENPDISFDEKLLDSIGF